MLWVRTFSVFLPSSTSSCVVWANPSVAQQPRIAHSPVIFIISLLGRAYPPTHQITRREPPLHYLAGGLRRISRKAETGRAIVTPPASFVPVATSKPMILPLAR